MDGSRYLHLLFYFFTQHSDFSPKIYRVSLPPPRLPRLRLRCHPFLPPKFLSMACSLVSYVCGWEEEEERRSLEKEEEIERGFGKRVCGDRVYLISSAIFSLRLKILCKNLFSMSPSSQVPSSPFSLL